MVKTIFRTILKLGVLGFSVLSFMDYMSEKNILSLILIGYVCLLTVGNIYRLYANSSRVFSSGSSVLVISALLCYLGNNDTNMFLYCSIFLQLLELIIFCKKAIISCISMFACHGSLIACILKTTNDNSFSFFHIVILITSCFPLFIDILERITCLILGYGSINTLLWINYDKFINPAIVYISGFILFIFSILLKVKNIDDSFFFYTIMAIISIAGKFINEINKEDSEEDS